MSDKYNSRVSYARHFVVCCFARVELRGAAPSSTFSARIQVADWLMLPGSLALADNSLLGRSVLLLLPDYWYNCAWLAAASRLVAAGRGAATPMKPSRRSAVAGSRGRGAGRLRGRRLNTREERDEHCRDTNLRTSLCFFFPFLF